MTRTQQDTDRLVVAFIILFDTVKDIHQNDPEFVFPLFFKKMFAVGEFLNIVNDVVKIDPVNTPSMAL